MAVAVERIPHVDVGAHEGRRLRPIVVLQCAAAVAAIAGTALALYFGAAPVRITVQAQVPVTQAGGEEGSRLTLSGETIALTRHVTCVPYLQFDSSTDQAPACEAAVHGRLQVAFVGLLLFVVGSVVWVLSHGDRAVGFSERRVFISNGRP